ncbi:MAG: cytochrome c553 [Myxococcota bacterium]|jgi:cytochrome c553
MSWFIFLFACAGRSVPPEAATASSQDISRIHMAEHLARATVVRDAVVRGDFDTARVGFQWLAAHEEDESLPREGLGWVGMLRVHAAEGATSESIEEQAAALGALANTCGGCHETLSMGPLLPELPAPAPTQLSGLGLHMAQHSWASDRMWAALVEPSSAAWERSLRVLGEVTMTAAEQDEWGLVAGSEALDGEVHRLAYSAMADDNPDTRADLYGQIVAQCATCHRASRGQPPL